MLEQLILARGPRFWRLWHLDICKEEIWRVHAREWTKIFQACDVYFCKADISAFKYEGWVNVMWKSLISLLCDFTPGSLNV